MLDFIFRVRAMIVIHLNNFWAHFLGGSLSFGLDLFLRLDRAQQARTLPVELRQSEGLVVHEELPLSHSLGQTQLQRGKAQLVLKKNLCGHHREAHQNDTLLPLP